MKEEEKLLNLDLEKELEKQSLIIQKELNYIYLEPYILYFKMIQ